MRKWTGLSQWWKKEQGAQKEERSNWVPNYTREPAKSTNATDADGFNTQENENQPAAK